MSHYVLKYWSHITDWTRIKEAGKTPEDTKSNEIKEIRKTIFESFKGLTASEGRLLLLGANDAQQSLRSYGELISNFYKYASRSNDNLKTEELATWREQILGARTSLFVQLSKKYKNK